VKLNMIDKKIILTENIGVPRSGEFVRIGVPFAKGELQSAEALAVLSPQKEEQPVQVTPLKHWNDGSIKWALLDFAATAQPYMKAIYSLITNPEKKLDSVKGIQIIPGKDLWQVDTGAAVFSIDAREFRPFASVNMVNSDILTEEGTCTLLTSDNNRPAPKVDSILVEAEGPLRAVLAVHGHFDEKGEEILCFSSRIQFFADSCCAHLEFTIHNPNPARHNGGLWDLGDAGSILFKELAFAFSFPADNITEIQCSPEHGKEPIRFDEAEGSLSVYQESSGGENWRSPGHRNRDGNVPFNLRGYEIRKGEKQIATGSRATPLFWCGSERRGFSAVLPRFWQEFPKAVTATRRGLKIALFPGCFPDLHELQGGEKKTHLIYLDFSSTPCGLEWARSPLSITASANDIRNSRVIFDLPSSDDKDSGKGDLIDRFITGPEEFLRKRESIDEYGWRNFGDIYADHEAVNHKGPEPFISHYNNQYDICAGLYRKFMATGDTLWGELASDLARHVIDIDIYQTDRDREEYNRSLFWHTDHYIPAGLSTHRTFSREQIGSRDPRFCGGGPGAEHCYTSGLMIHYFLTGNPTFRDAVINLAEWSYRSLSDCHTILATIKKAGRYFSILRNSTKDKEVAFPIFPLSRGTGNTINACLDAFEVSAEKKFLEQAEKMIRGAIHPEDDLGMRNLLDPENTWSYAVLLASVIKYLIKQEEREDYNEGYHYARACLLVYAEWMAKHEYPYLEKPEILEYPNETWTAQDLRKSVIFYNAARYAEPAQRAIFLERGRFFYKNAAEELARHLTSGFTRPLALILQNAWAGSRLEGDVSLAPTSAHPEMLLGRPTPNLDRYALLVRIAGELSRALRETSIRREIDWVRTRLQR
jgi:hypothetical protein